MLTPDFLMTKLTSLGSRKLALGIPFWCSEMSFNIILHHYSAVHMRDSSREEFNFQVRFHKILDPKSFLRKSISTVIGSSICHPLNLHNQIN